MKIHSTTGRRLLVLGALVGPVILFQSARFLMSTPQAPSAANATTTAAPAPAAPARGPAALSPEQTRAIEWLAKQPERPSRSPMEAPLRKVVVDDEPVEVVAEAPTPPPPAAPGLPPLTLSLIMNSRGESVAILSGKTYRKGDEVASGWKVDKIDHDAWSVTLRHPDGRSAEINAVKR
ncbi:MAG: hypothetical protein KF745_00570 [Phycisphaeraceae bacterium]|nr:hypothetical protein [Phycisphaeraceae bacterium]